MLSSIITYSTSFSFHCEWFFSSTLILSNVFLVPSSHSTPCLEQISDGVVCCAAANASAISFIPSSHESACWTATSIGKLLELSKVLIEWSKRDAISLGQRYTMTLVVAKSHDLFQRREQLPTNRRERKNNNARRNLATRVNYKHSTVPARYQVLTCTNTYTMDIRNPKIPGGHFWSSVKFPWYQKVLVQVP